MIDYKYFPFAIAQIFQVSEKNVPGSHRIESADSAVHQAEVVPAVDEGHVYSSVIQ